MKDKREEYAELILCRNCSYADLEPDINGELRCALRRRKMQPDDFCSDAAPDVENGRAGQVVRLKQ